MGRMLDRLMRMTQIVKLPVLKFLRLAIIPILHWAVVAGDPTIDLRGPAAVRTAVLFAAQIPMIAAD